MQNEIRNIELWIYMIHKNGYKNMNERKLVTNLYNSYRKPMVYY